MTHANLTWREKIWRVIESAETQCRALGLSGADRETLIRSAKPYWVRTCSWQTKLWQQEMRRLFGSKRKPKPESMPLFDATEESNDHP